MESGATFSYAIGIMCLMTKELLTIEGLEGSYERIDEVECSLPLPKP
jgi:hypothetical protein